MDDLYEKIILKHANNPNFFGSEDDLKEDFIEADNPLCGDSYRIKFKWDQEDNLEDAIFFGYGCTISKAAGSILLSKMVGKNKEEILGILDLMKDVVEGQGELGKEMDEELKAFRGARKYPSRKPCAMLIGESIRGAYF